MATYQDLITFIEDEAPYPPPIDFDIAGAIKEGFAQANNKQNPSQLAANQLSDVQNRTSIWVHIGGEFRRGTKTLLVPIKFVRNGNFIDAHVGIVYFGPGV